MSNQYTHSGASISSDGQYRYRLWREWRGTHDPKNWRWLGAKDGAGHELGEPKACVFVMLNPSTADETKDDPTIRKCVGFAKRWRYERLEVVNLFAHRATNPKELLRLGHDDDPVGPWNQMHTEKIVANAGIIVCGWGVHGNHLNQDETTLGWIDGWGVPIVALGLTKDGYPKHPLYLPYDAVPLPFKGTRR